MSALTWDRPDADPVADILAMADMVAARTGRLRRANRPFHLSLSERFYDRCVAEGILDPQVLLDEHHIVVHRGGTA